MASAHIRDILTAFNPSLDFFAITTGDGRIKIWDTLKGQVQTEFADFSSTHDTNLFDTKGHLSVDYTCIKWMSFERKKKRKHSSSLLVLGTGSGDVLALDVSAGQLSWKINDCHPGGVRAISSLANGSTFYTSGADGMICAIDFTTGNLLEKFKASSKAVTSISVSPDGKKLATAAAQLKIFNCSNKKKIEKFSGHPGSVRCMVFTEDGKYILSTAAAERYVAVWKLDGAKKQSVSCVLAMEHPAVFLDSRCIDKGEDDEAVLCVLAISEVGVCYLWFGNSIEELRNAKPTKISLSLEDMSTKNYKGALPAIYAAKLQSIQKPASGQFFLVSGMLVKPSFQNILLHSGTDVKLSVSRDGVLLPISQSIVKSKKRTDVQRVTALDRANAEDALLPIPKVFDSHEKDKSFQVTLGKDVKDDLLTSGTDSMEIDDGVVESETGVISMEDRMRSVGLLYSESDCASNFELCSKLLKGIDLEATLPKKKIRATVDKEITDNSRVQSSPSPDFNRTSRTSPVVDSLCQPTLPDPLSELKNDILQIEDNFCILKDCSADGTANSTIRKPSYPESGQSSSVLVTSSSPKDVPDLLSKGNRVSIKDTCAADNPGQTNNDGQEAVEVDCITESILLPSQSNSQTTEFGRNTQTRKASRKSTNKASVTHPSGGMKINLEASRKKRSCSSKPGRSSAWGLMGNIEQFFQYENELEVSEAMCQNVGKARNNCQGGKTTKNSTSSSSLSSVPKYNVSTSTTRFRLKIKYGKENDLPASASYNGPDSGSQKVISNSADKVSVVLALNSLGSFRNDPDKDCVVLNGHTVNSQLENSKITEKSEGDVEEPCHAVPPERVVEALVKPINNSATDPGTSPDSEVIDSIPEVQVGERHEDVHLDVLGSSNELNSNQDVTFQKRGKKKDKPIGSGNCITEDASHGQLGNNGAVHSKNHRHKNCNDVASSLELSTSTELSKSIKSKELAAESLPLSGETVLGGSAKALKAKSHATVKTVGKTFGGHEFSKFQGSEDLPSSTRPLGRKLPKSLEPTSKFSKAKSNGSDSTSRKKTTTRRKEKQKEPVNKSEVKGKGLSQKVTREVEDCPHPDADGNQKLDAVVKINPSDNRVSVNPDIMPGLGLGEQPQSPRNAWVSCDDCHKWRRIPAVLADRIDETNCTWTCKDSGDKAFADCAIPQEKSNAEINAELGLSYASGEEDVRDESKNYKELEYRLPMVSQGSSFTHISTNEFLHRNPKTQTIDEVMVCHCKPPPEGKLGCGDECLNRMLNIECVQGTCPCGDHCSNQQFQNRKYSRLKWFKCGKKGYGLKALERVAKGHFIIEYVGEVLDMHAYEARQREYALKGHRHFYFMTLNGSEVIDASAKGNLGRFINHSCDPNCRTEKWMVNGEICIGLFALRHIKQDEELTFDYNYVRVFGAAAKKCYCGSPHCRGYIGGGDPLKDELIVQGDSDDEFPEPMMLTEDGEVEDSIPMPKYYDNVDTESSRHLLTDMDVLDKSTTAIDADGSPEKDSSIDPASAVSLLHSSVDVEDSKGSLPSSDRVEEISQQMDDTTSKPIPAVSKVLSNSTDSRESKSEMVEGGNGFSQSHLHVKTQRSASGKKAKVSANAANSLTAEVQANRLPVSSTKHKKVVEGSSNARFEAVQGKLNELLDGNGGISKRKDATKGYLKLLLLTVASGDRINGEAIQSNRDLSMILDALLKTKSRAVLNDVISKNGLQMLHKIMKQYRQDFKKIPILRKLLKVLEYLAAGKVLTLEHIKSGPPCRGMESFRESMLSLTEHDDKQVHQIARSFRDRWIPRHGRKRGYMDRDDNRESHRNFNCNRFSASHNHRQEQRLRPKEAIDCGQQSKPVTTSTSTSVDAGAPESCSTLSLNGVEIKGEKKRKRKSRWDQPAETNSYSDAVIGSTNESRSINEEIPPGFSCPIRSLNSTINSGGPVLLNASNPGWPSSLVTGQPKQKFNSRLPVSYGMPWSVAQQYGTPHAEIKGCWVTAPGMPFNPFPPLPPHPRDIKDCQPSNTNGMEVDQHAEIKQRETDGLVNCYSEADDMIPSTTGAKSEDTTNLECKDEKHDPKRLKGNSNDLGKDNFKQQKWNNSKIHRTWFKRNAGKCNGNNSSGDVCSVDVGVPKESKVISYLEDAICRDETGGK